MLKVFKAVILCIPSLHRFLKPLIVCYVISAFPFKHLKIFYIYTHISFAQLNCALYEIHRIFLYILYIFIFCLFYSFSFGLNLISFNITFLGFFAFVLHCAVIVSFCLLILHLLQCTDAWVFLWDCVCLYNTYECVYVCAKLIHFWNWVIPIVSSFAFSLVHSLIHSAFFIPSCLRFFITTTAEYRSLSVYLQIFHVFDQK